MISFGAVQSGDLETICGHRRRMFAENDVSLAALDAMAAPFAEWLGPRLADGRYFGLMAEDAGAVVGGIGLIVLDFPPHFLHPGSGERGYILNVYVEPAHRGQGLAKELVLRGEEEFRRRGVVFEVLHASAMGRPVYESLGWMAMPEMGKAL